jgi:thiosulfate/3-mercaptopyruvate sulfurtransferase
MRPFPTLAALLLASAPLALGAQRTTPDSLVVTTAWLAAHLADPAVVVVEVVRDSTKRGAHIAGSRVVRYRQYTVTRDGLSTELPSVDSLKTLFESLGISSTSRVVVYASEAPMATRLLMTLDYLGHRRFSYLDGGLPKWIAERRATSEDEPAASRAVFNAAPRTDLVVTADWLSSRIGTPGLALIDTRTTGEYNGSGNRSGMPSAGHLDGARQIEWESLFETDNPLLLKDRKVLRQMYNGATRTGDTVVTYCWVGYRGSATYFVARVLGLNARFYDGSYQDWQQRKLPTKAGETP